MKEAPSELFLKVKIIRLFTTRLALAPSSPFRSSNKLWYNFFFQRTNHTNLGKWSQIVFSVIQVLLKHK